MKTRNLHKIATFLIACLILACCLVARASAQELSTEQCGAWIEKTNVFASGTLIRNNNHEILKHPHDAGYYLVWYQGTLYYE